MTKQDFELMADCLRVAFRTASTDEERQGVRLAAEAFVDKLHSDFPRFDVEKFRNYINTGRYGK